MLFSSSGQSLPAEGAGPPQHAPVGRGCPSREHPLPGTCLLSAHRAVIRALGEQPEVRWAGMEGLLRRVARPWASPAGQGGT